jgi:thiosulfate/3-mercaptopyruvate sulfurtransferase
VKLGGTWAVAFPMTLLIAADARQAVAQRADAHASGGLVLVTAGWLATHLHDRDLRIVQVGHERGEYDAAHIPGARYLSFMEIAPERGGLHAQMPAASELRSVLQGAGISDGSHIVIYGDALAAARLLLALDYVGLGANASVLDGGIDAWRAAGGPLSGAASPPAQGSIKVRDHPGAVVDAAWVRARLREPGVRIVDARSPTFYRGENPPGPLSARPGHVAGAASVPYSSLLDATGRMRDTASLRALFAAAGIRPADRVVTYCHIGMQASLLYLAARALGHEASVYDGSYEEWSKAAASPIETGASGSH